MPRLAVDEAARRRARRRELDRRRGRSRSRPRAGHDVASIGTLRGAELAGLEVLASEIEDHPENETRFVLVGRGIPAPTGHDKTSIVCFQREDRPGSLLAILQEFAARAINLTKLESRPTKRGLGEYCFFIDFEGHISDEVVADCLRNLAANQAEVKFLGSYPVAGEEGPERRRAVSEAWNAASAWIDGSASPGAHARPVIDLKALRDDPEYRAGDRAQAGRSPGSSTRCWVSTPSSVAQQQRVEELRARQKRRLEGDRQAPHPRSATRDAPRRAS